MLEMATTPPDDQLARYLLGTLPEADHQQIDERVMTDAQLFEQLSAVENELAYDYAIGLLGADDRVRFEQRFLHRPAVQERVRVAQSLLQTIRWTERYPAQQGVSRWVIFASAAAAAASIVLVGWVLQDNARVRRELDAVRSAADASRAGATTAPNPEPSPLAPPQSPSPPPTAPESSQTATAPAPPASSLMVSMVLQPGLVRADATPRRIRVAPGIAGVRLQLELPAAAASFATYRAVVRTPDDVEVWSERVTRNRAEPPLLSLTVPARALTPNDYEIAVFGVPATGAAEEVANYTFSVVRN